MHHTLTKKWTESGRRAGSRFNAEDEWSALLTDALNKAQLQQHTYTACSAVMYAMVVEWRRRCHICIERTVFVWVSVYIAARKRTYILAYVCSFVLVRIGGNSQRHLHLFAYKFRPFFHGDFSLSFVCYACVWVLFSVAVVFRKVFTFLLLLLVALHAKWHLWIVYLLKLTEGQQNITFLTKR